MSTGVLSQEAMKVSIEAVSSVKKSLHVEVSEEIVTDAYHHALEHLQNDVRLPGFRAGKAPLALLMKRYEEELRKAVLRGLLPGYCQKAIQEAGLFPVGAPYIHDIALKKDAPLYFTVDVDIRPEIQLSNYTGLSIPRHDVTVSESDIAKGIEGLRERLGYLEHYPEDHVIALSDHVRIDYVGTVDGKPLRGAQEKDYVVRVDSKTVYPSIEESLIGKKKGDIFSVEVLLPEHYPDIRHAGKPAQFKIEVKEISAKRLPALDDEFAKDLGVPSLSELTEKVKVAIRAEKEIATRMDQKELLVKQLIESHPIEAPQPMIEWEIRNILQEEIDLEQMSKTAPDLYKKLHEMAKPRVQKKLILEAIAEKEQIVVQESDIEAAIRVMTEKAGVPFEKGKREILQKPYALENLRDILRKEKALEHVYSLAQFETV